MDTPILVTGATGNVGRPLVGELLRAGHRVRALSTDPAAAYRTLAADAGPDDARRLTAARFDFADAATFAEAFAGARAMFLLRPPAISDAAGVINPAVDAAVAAGVHRVAFLSIQGAERNPVVPHHAVERHLEQLAARGDAAYTFLRAAFFMQNLSTTHAADVRELGEVLVPAGDGRTAFVDARDVAAAAARALADPAADGAHANRAYELTSREALTYDEVAAVLTRVLGRPIVYRHPGALRFYRHMRRRGFPRAYVGVMVALYTTARLGLAAHLSPELETLLGRAPTSFEQFARDYADAWR